MIKKIDLIDIANTTMPFGKYAGKTILELPEEYLLWFQQKAFPEGRLGYLMALCLEIKTNGAEDVLKPLKNAENVWTH